MEEQDFNRVEWPDGDDFERLPITKAGLKNWESFLRDTALYAEITGGEEWPKVEKWFTDPTALERDFAAFTRVFTKLVNHDPDNGYYFEKEPRFRLTWRVCSQHFLTAYHAAIAIESFPLSLSALQRVIEIANSYDKEDEFSEECISDQIGPCIRTTSKPRYSFCEQKTLCEEALGIIETLKAALKLFVKLKGRQTGSRVSRPNRTETTCTKGGTARMSQTPA